MADSNYKIITIIGSSPESWEKAASNAVKKAAQTLRDVRIAEIVELDMKIGKSNAITYRAKVNLSFRVEIDDEQLLHKDSQTWFLEKEHHSFDG
jgi:dodecin